MVKMLALMCILLGACTEKKKSLSLNTESVLEVAEKELIEVYGLKVLKQRPFRVKETETSLIVIGTLHCSDGMICKGGVAEIKYNKFSGKIENITHGK